MAASPLPVAAMYTEQAQAFVALLEGDAAGAVAVLRGLLTPIESRGMRAVAASLRCQIGRLVGGSEGQTLVERGIRALAAEGWSKPERFTHAAFHRVDTSGDPAAVAFDEAAAA